MSERKTDFMAMSLESSAEGCCSHSSFENTYFVKSLPKSLHIPIFATSISRIRYCYKMRISQIQTEIIVVFRNTLLPPIVVAGNKTPLNSPKKFSGLVLV